MGCYAGFRHPLPFTADAKVALSLFEDEPREMTGGNERFGGKNGGFRVVDIEFHF